MEHMTFDWSILTAPAISAGIGALASGAIIEFKNRFGGIRAMREDISDMKRVSQQHNSLLLALAKALFASTKREKDDAKVELLEVYSKLGGQ
jgi:hypothetical protein